MAIRVSHSPSPRPPGRVTCRPSHEPAPRKPRESNMIRHQLVQWILLPNGLTATGQLAASVFVAPRLRPSEPATLNDFPDFADWRSVLDGMTLVLERADGVTESPIDVAV